MSLGPLAREFDQLSRRYSALIEDGPSDREEWLAQVEVALADLYATALRLPLTDPTNAEPPERSANRLELMTKVAEKLGQDNGFYRFVFNPFWDNDEPVGGTIADDLVSVYADLQAGCQMLAASASLEDVVWEWQFQFRSHWGRHAAAALYAIRASDLTGPRRLPSSLNH
jgi:Domain of unknown function (DUF5063)